MIAWSTGVVEAERDQVTDALPSHVGEVHWRAGFVALRSSCSRISWRRPQLLWAGFRAPATIGQGIG
jgi:hypothetical protein